MPGVTSLNSAGRISDTGPGPYVSRNKVITSALVMDGSNDDQNIVIDAAAGLAITLPTAVGSGAKYRFYVKTTITSNSTTIKVNNSTDSFIGFSHALDGGTTKGFGAVAGTSDTITFNGGTTGGLAGDFVEIIDLVAGLFSVQILGQAATAATPFSATV